MSSWVKHAYQRIWKNGGAPTVQLNGATCLPSYVDRRIRIVRDEYIGLWEYIEKDRVVPREDVGGLVVLGQPGIGKSIFLSYALAMALSKKIPVVFCDDNQAYWFCDDDDAQLLTFSHQTVNDIPERSLILVDSNAGMRGVPPLFTKARFEGYVVQASSPDTARWYAWKKERRAKVWIMGLWTKDEVSLLQNLREKNSENGWGEGFPPTPCPWTEGTTYSPVELFDILGPSARTCFSAYTKSERGFEFDLLSGLNPGQLLLDSGKLLQFIASSNVPEGQQGGAFHRFFFGSLSNKFSNPVEGPDFEYQVPTFFLRGALLSSFRSLKLQEQKSFASLIAPHPHLFWIFFEQAAVRNLTSSTTGHPYQLCRFPCALQLGPGLVVDPFVFDPNVFNAKDKPFTPTTNRIYIPHDGFESFDAFVVQDELNHIIFLQFTTAKNHDFKTGGIHAVIKCFPQDKRQSTFWSFLFVSPTERAKGIAEGHMNDLKRFNVDGEQITVNIGWSVIQTGDPFDEIAAEFTREDSSKRRKISE